ncbi:hypothetical protein BSL78_24623 [Apostichopus japonicus]|uniref:Short-chain collagen C4-like n=1 Tax=Stichopus japonicus TaxID=307972 RepID=A0A2G8JS41_STIJA|nr:hypothetical protein BSL78_24623 [Apostichopus japonicus]
MAASWLSALILTAIICSSMVYDANGYPNQKEEEEVKRIVEKELRELKDRLQELERRSAWELENSESSRKRRNADKQDTHGPIGNDASPLGPFTPFYSGQCFLCPVGAPGPRGPPGPSGTSGRDGRDGRDWSGCGGSNGDGPTDPEEPPSTNGSSGGTVFVRWGRSECPSTSELVYSGTAGGAHYTHKGSGSNYLCMPEEPIYDEPQAGTSGQNRALVYGAEYEMNTYAQWNHLHDNNVPCAVCWAPSRPSLLMIPARNVCPDSEWTTEYSGYLVGAYYNHEGRTQFVCMDKTPEVVSRSSHNANGALFYVAEGRCGSSGSGLPCGPYVEGNELTCAVCTR